MSLPRASPPGSGLDSNVVVRLAERLGELGAHSFMIVRDQQVVAEAWWAPYRRDYRHSLYSLTKSFTSTAIGFAVQEGLLTVNDPVLKFFPQLLPCKPCEYMTKMTIRDMLTMSTGHTTEPLGWKGIPRSQEQRNDDEDHVYRFLTSYVNKEPGSHFLYNTPATFMCGAVLKAVTGQSVFDFLKPRLLDPLGITNYHSAVSKNGYNPAGFGGHFTTEDIAKFGIFLLNRGAWNGKQLLSTSWIDEATSPLADNSNQSSGRKESMSGYGYQFWKCSPPGIYRGDGAFGQYCVVMPDQNAVVAITSGSRQMHLMLDALWDILLPELNKEPQAAAVNSEMLATLDKLHIPMPSDKPHAEPSPFSGRVYKLAPNILRLTQLSVKDDGKSAAVTFWRGDESCTANVGYSTWVDTVTGPDDDGLADIFSQIACAGAWDGNTFHLKIMYTGTPFSDTFAMHFDDKGLVLEYRRDPTNEEVQIVQMMGREA